MALQSTRNTTPGPWHVDPRNTPYYSSIEGAWFIRGPEDEYIARLTDESRTDLGDPEESGTAYDPRPFNARLIAKAPEMHELLATLLYELEAAPDTNYRAHELRQRIRALLSDLDDPI